MSKYLYRLPLHKNIVKPLIASLGMGFFVFYFMDANLLVLVFAAAMVYFVIFVGIKGFDKEDWELIKRLIKKGE